MSETRAEAVRLFGLGGGRPALPTFSRALSAYAEEVRAETLTEAEEKIREAVKGHEGTGLCPEISTARGAADLVHRIRSES